ncbi:phospholipid-translocating ATPase rsb1 [Knufia fluminis]|uniref:Phospholipid-translocating ATPase rsb1 n=1 Tax=Knufia fluminis TaxID=191047 RepID=A0AAN8I6I7_9EURO|nr:phospholipid-translocating ATPase rsb1 [Knufia fluminis]
MVSASDFTQTCNFTIESDFCTAETCCLEQGQIHYIPTLAGNAAYAALFAILIIPNLTFGIRYKTWSFMSWLCLGLIGETVGYIGRIMLNDNIFSFNGFLMYLIPLTIAPAFITASIYLCLARVIYILDPNLMHTRLKPMTYTKIFVTFDIISLILQAAGGGLAATADDQAGSDMGINVMIAGLAFQVVSLLIFIGLCSDFAWRLYKGIVSKKMRFTVTDADTTYPPSQGLARRPTWMRRSEEVGGDSALDYTSIKTSVMFKGFIGALGVATFLILVRSSYRLAELQEGFDGELANDQLTFMILEGPMIILSCIALTAFHPGFALRRLWSMKGFQGRAGSPSAGEKLVMTSASNSAVGSRDGSREDLSAEQRAPAVGGSRYESLRA